VHIETAGELRLLRFDSLPRERVDAFVSTRSAGNIALHVGDDEEAVLATRERLFAAAGRRLDDTVWCQQIHLDRVCPVDAQFAARGAFAHDDALAGTDALMTDTPGLTLCVAAADCATIVLYDPAVHAAAAVHAGWGGTVTRIASRAVAAMGERYGTSPSDLLAAIGPAIGPDDYEVGPEVILAVLDSFEGAADELLHPTRPGHARLDLWLANVLDLQQAGVAAERIELAAMSTATHLDELYSHRAEHNTGRFVTAVTLQPRPEGFDDPRWRAGRAGELPPGTAIAREDPRAGDVRALLEAHLAYAHGNTEPGKVYALDIEELLHPDIQFFGLRVNGELLAVGALKRLDAGHGELKSMHTAATARRLGIGRAIVAHLVDAARAQGFERVSLETGAQDAFAPARGLYAATGFTPCGPFGDYPDSPDSAFMTRVL
jgi:YfiH family protein